MEYSETKLLKFSKVSYELAKRVIRPYSSKFSKKTYTQQQHIAVLCIKAKKNQKFEQIEEILKEMASVCAVLGLDQVPDHTTICRNFGKLKRKVLIVLLYLTACILPRSGKCGIDASALDKRHSSKHYVKRCKIKLKCMKITLLIDTEQLTILAIHITVTRKHDSKIILPLISKADENFLIKVLVGDKGYDDKEIRDELRKLGIRPLIPHREFKNIDKAHNARIKKKDYHRRSMNETVNSMIKRNYTDELMTRSWKNQYKEVLFLAIVHNLDRFVSKMAKIGGLQ